MKLTEIYTSNSDYLKAEHIPANVRVPVTIESYKVVEMDDGEGGKKKQVCLSFEGKDKKLGLNKTNAQMIAHLIETDDVDKWIGYKIKLYRSKTEFQGKQVDCIRIDDGFCELPDGTSKFKEVDSSSIPF